MNKGLLNKIFCITFFAPDKAARFGPDDACLGFFDPFFSLVAISACKYKI